MKEGNFLTQKEITVLGLRKKGLTQTEIAKRLRISQAAVSDFENNALLKIKAAEMTLKTAKGIGVEAPRD